MAATCALIPSWRPSPWLPDEDRRQRQLCLGFVDPVLALGVYHDKRLFAKSLQLSSLIVLVSEELSLCVSGSQKRSG